MGVNFLELGESVDLSDVAPGSILVIEAATAILSGARKTPPAKMEELAAQMDIIYSKDAAVRTIIGALAINKRSAKKQTETLVNVAQFASKAARHDLAGDMFGGQNVTLDDVIKRFNHDTTSTETMGLPGGSGLAQNNVGEQAADQASTPDLATTEEPLTLRGQTPEEIAAEEEAKQAVAKAREGAQVERLP